jgi:hypothetical protein
VFQTNEKLVWPEGNIPEEITLAGGGVVLSSAHMMERESERKRE